MTLELVGQGMEVPVLGGGTVPGTFLDAAASTPALTAVHDAVEEFLPWYSSVHRGAGWTSQIATRAYEASRRAVADFVGARDDDVVVFTRNTTDAMNMLASAVPADGCVVTFAGEHHANMLPWRRGEVTHLPVPQDPTDLVPMLAEALASCPADKTLVAVTGASNVTGELWPVADLAACAHANGARIVVDAAQLAPHAVIDMAGDQLDWIAMSGHKLYAPYGAGALVGRQDWLDANEPHLAGGGAVAFVTLEDVAWTRLPDRQEAGSPNVVGAVAMAAACRVLGEHGMDRIAAHEADLAAHADRRLAAIPGVRPLRLWGEGHPRIGVATFDVDGMDHGLVATILSAEHGIAVRDGCFCAHPLMLRLLDVPDAEAERIRSELVAGRHAAVPGAIRMSTSVVTTTADLDHAIDCLEQVIADGPTATYRHDEAHGTWHPDPDDRPLPPLAALAGADLGDILPGCGV